MPYTDPAHRLASAPVDELVRLLLRQFTRLLAEREITLARGDIDAIAGAVAAGQPLPEAAARATPVIGDLVDESMALLEERFGLSFDESLNVAMDHIPGWVTTSDFLAIANDKANAELRISAGSALLVFLGDEDYAPLLFSVLDADAATPDVREMDVDAQIARRALLHMAGVPTEAEDWVDQLHAAWPDSP
jgi:hypothetical protein